jgi:hypothetical protein
MRIRLLTAALLLTSTALAASPAAKAQRVQIRVPFWADSSEWKPADLTARLDGSPAQIAGIHGPSEGLMLLVVFDVVGDVARVDPARESLIAAMEKAPPSVYVGLLRAQDGLRVLMDPTGDRQAMADAIRAIPVSGRPGLLDTIEQAAELADSVLAKTTVRMAVLYITDSDIYSYRDDYTNPVINSSDSRDLSRRFPEGLVREKISKIESRISALDAPLFIAHLAYAPDRLNEAYQTGLLQLAQVTGGSAVFCRSPADVNDAVGQMFMRIANHWAVDVRLPDRPLKSVQVQLEGASGLSYRTRFVLKER